MANINVSGAEPRQAQRNDGADREIVATREQPEFAPAVDIYENQDELLLVVDLPGVDSKGVKVDYDAPELRIRGQREESGNGGASYFRAFRVDERIDPNGIDAELRNGVLFVHLKKSADLKPRRVEVKAN